MRLPLALVRLTTAGLYGAFALPNIAARSSVGQRTLKSFAIDAPSLAAPPDSLPATADPTLPRAAVAQDADYHAQPVSFVPAVTLYLRSLRQAGHGCSRAGAIHVVRGCGESLQKSQNRICTERYGKDSACCPEG